MVKTSGRVYASEGLADGDGVWGTFWSDNDVLYFGRNLGYTGVYVCQNSVNGKLKFLHTCI